MATSNHLRGATELMLIADVKDGFVENATQLVSYATRLKRLLSLLLEGGRSDAEIKLRPGAGPIQRLDAIYSTQWAVVERPQHSQLIVSAVFDSSFETYFRNLQLNTGLLLDAIFMHCTDYDGHSCSTDGYERFASWIRKKQVQTSYFHVAMADLTVSDLRLARARSRLPSSGGDVIPSVAELERAAEARDEQRARTAADTVEGRTARKAAQKRSELGYRTTLRSIDELGAFFPANAQDDRLGERSAQVIYRTALLDLLASSFDETLKQRARTTISWLSSLAPGQPAQRQPFREPVPSELTLEQLTNMQGNIVQAYDYGQTKDRLNCGCLVLIQCDDRAAISTLLLSLADKVANGSHLFESVSHTQKPRYNVALTFAGMTRLELSPDLLAALPQEFREGMEKRAGLLGDVGDFAHPSTWEAPAANWFRDGGPDADDAGSISLASVDVVLVAQRALSAQHEQSTDDHAWSVSHPLYKDLHDLLDEYSRGGSHVLHVQPLRRYSSDHFALGEEAQLQSQPVPNVALRAHPEGLPSARVPTRDLVPLGELLLGHPNRFGETYGAEALRAHGALLQDGSFLVVRKLEQDVAGFRGYLRKASAKLKVEEGALKSWILGRSAGGQTLAEAKRGKPAKAEKAQNDFDYSGDPAPAQCPLHAHVRLANPRAAETPRIMRRSFPYGGRYRENESKATERGLLFMAYNASIAEQFEMVQRWLNGANITGLASTENDLISGTTQAAFAKRWGPHAKPTLEIPPTEQPFVSLRWGMYLFVPTISALKWMAREPARAAQEDAGSAQVRAGARLVQALSAIERKEDSIVAWKGVLEDQVDRDKGDAVWAYVRAQNDGLLATPYGLLVGTLSPAKTVLEDDGTSFSVEAYRRRLSLAFYGDERHDTHYIGLDAVDPRHALLSAAPNAYLNGRVLDHQSPHGQTKDGQPTAHRGLSADHMYYDAFTFAAEFLHDVSTSSTAESDLESGAPIDVRALAGFVVASITGKYLGLPFRMPARGESPEALIEFISLFVPISRYCFQPWPDSEKELLRETLLAGPQILAAYQRDEPLAHVLSGGLGAYLNTLSGCYQDPMNIRWAVIGAIVGFAPPAIAVIIQAVLGWVQTGEFDRLVHALQVPAPEQLSGPERKAERRALPGERGARDFAQAAYFGLFGVILKTLLQAPVPPVLYRTVKNGSRLGSQRLSDSEFVVLGTRSIGIDRTKDSSPWQGLAAKAAGAPVHTPSAAEARSVWTFGGARPGRAPHACPASDPAVAVMTGVMAALLLYPQTKLVGPFHVLLGRRAQIADNP